MHFIYIYVYMYIDRLLYSAGVGDPGLGFLNFWKFANKGPIIYAAYFNTWSEDFRSQESTTYHDQKWVQGPPNLAQSACGTYRLVESSDPMGICMPSKNSLYTRNRTSRNATKGVLYRHIGTYIYI